MNPIRPRTMMKVLLHHDASPGFRDALQTITPPDIRLVIVPEADNAAFAREVIDTDVILHVLLPLTPAMLAPARALRLIQKIGVGVNTIALDYAGARGIAVCNMPGTNSQAVAEHTLLFMLAALRRVCWLDAETRKGQGWQLPRAAFDSMGEISGRTVGLVGFGAAPQRLAAALTALGARVLCTNRSGMHTDGVPWCELTSLLAQSDIVSLHVPATPETRHLINATRLAQMKRGAVLINTARGELVDQQALLAALQSGQLRAAGLDVFEPEPLTMHPLFDCPNVILTPHIAWLTPETLARSMTVALDNCARLAQGQPLQFRVR